MKQKSKIILSKNKKIKQIITAGAILLTVAISGSLVACSSNKSDSISSSRQIESTNTSSTAEQNTQTDKGQKNKTAETSNSKPETGLTYKTESDFLNSPEGVNFQKIAYKSAKAYLSGDLKQMSKYFVEPKDASLKTENIFNNLEYMILKWNLGDIKSENEINASYEFKVNGEDSVSYITMELKKVDNNWKVKSIALEK
ncbi:hypothetical protein [Clostridium sp. JNZ J1-5]